MNGKLYNGRRHRRLGKQTLRHGSKAKRRHARLGGRTGSIRHKGIKQ